MGPGRTGGKFLPNKYSVNYRHVPAVDMIDLISKKHDLEIEDLGLEEADIRFMKRVLAPNPPRSAIDVMTLGNPLIAIAP